MLRFKSNPSSVLTIQQQGVLSRRHVRLRPTKFCLSLLVLCVAIWLGAVNYQVNVAYAVCFWLLGFIGIAALLTRRQLLGLSIHIDEIEEVFAGQTAQIRWYAQGLGKRSRLFWWRSENEEDHITPSWQRVLLFNQQKQDNTWSIKVVRRGYFPSPLRLVLATSAPFGLFHVESHVLWETDAVVFPAPLEHNHANQHARPDTEATPQHTSQNGEDIAFLKNHQEGSSLQHVAWKVYAKRGELMDKVFDEPPRSSQEENISYEDYPSGTPLDKLASLLTYRVLQAERLGLPYTLILPKQTILPQNHQREKCLNALALM